MIDSRRFGTDLTNAFKSPQHDINTKLKKGKIKQQSRGFEIIKPTTNKSIKQIQRILYDQPLSKFDEALKENDLYSTEYINEIMTSFFQNEKAITPYIHLKKSDTNSQKTVSKRSRRIFLNWIASICTRFELLDITYFLTANMIDRYLSATKGVISHNTELKLIGCATLWIVTKYHEIYPPEASDFCRVTSYNIDIAGLEKMELQILATIGFSLTVETPLSFIERFYQIGCYYIDCNAQNGDANKLELAEKQKNILKSMMMYGAEICLLSYDISLELPSKSACSVLYYCCIGTGIFSYKQLERDGVLKHVNGYTMMDLLSIIKEIHKIAIQIHKEKDTRIYKKYSSSVQHRVTSIPSKMHMVGGSN